MEEKVKLMKNNAAIDAAILTKDMAVEGVIKYFDCPLEKIAAIGDEITDLPLLSKNGLGLVGTVANAQARVKQAVNGLASGYVSQKEFFDGFMDFYNKATQEGIEIIISDRDGVLKSDILKSEENIQFGLKFRDLALQMGQARKPYVTILSGSSYEQNIPFMKTYGLDVQLSINPAIVKYPYLLLIENGAIHLNVINGETKNYVGDICPDLLTLLKNKFEIRTKRRISAEVLPEFGFKWTEDSNDQKGRVYHPKKLSMVTFNVPSADVDGKSFRKTREAEKYRDMIVGIMEEVAKSISMPYEVL